MGDFNYVAHRRDRFSKMGTAPGSAEPSDEDHFCKLLRDPFEFCELQQEEYTHDKSITAALRQMWNVVLQPERDTEAKLRTNATKVECITLRPGFRNLIVVEPA